MKSLALTLIALATIWSASAFGQGIYFTTSARATYATNGASVDIQSSISTNLATALIDTVVGVTTNESQFSLGSVTNAGIRLFLKTVSTQSWASVRADSTNGIYFAKISAAPDFAQMPLDSTNLFLVAGLPASNQTVNVRVVILPPR